MAFFTDLTRKIGVFGCKFYSHKNCVSVKKMTIIRYALEQRGVYNHAFGNLADNDGHELIEMH